MREGRNRVHRVGGEWEYLDGSRWPSLNALRDHLMHRAAMEHGVPDAVRRMAR